MTKTAAFACCSLLFILYPFAMEHRKRAPRGNDHIISYGGATGEKSGGRRPRKSGRKSSITISLYTILKVGILSYALLMVCLLGTDMFTRPIKDRSSFERVLYQDLTSQVTVETGPVASGFLPQRPRAVGFYFEKTDSDSYAGFEIIDPNVIRLLNRHEPSDMTPDAWERQKDLKDSKKYRRGKSDRFEHDDCVAQYDWQKTSNPTCNLLHEKDLTDLKEYKGSNQQLMANGFWRDVWKTFDPWSKSVLKTMRYEHAYVPRNYDRHRRDAVAMEQLTSSQNVVDIFAFCGNSGIFEFADGGDIDASLYNSAETEWSSKEKLIIAHQLVSGLADTHNFAREGIAAIVHTDITTSQFVYFSETGAFKLNDFNRCRFIAFSKEKNDTCTFEVGNNPGTFRSPEEYEYKGETEKIDVYSLGNVFYVLLTKLYPFEDLDESSEDVQKKIMKRSRPHIGHKFNESDDPFTQALIKTINMCWVHDPIERASSLEVQQFLQSELKRQGVDADISLSKDE